MNTARGLFAALFCAAAFFGITGCGHQPAKADTAASPAAAPDAAVSESNGEIALSPAAVEAGNIQAEAIAPESIASDIRATGQVVPNEDRTYRVGAHVSGRISSIEVSLGDRVGKDQILLRLHSHEIHDTRAAYLVARDALVQARERSAYAQRVRDRAHRLLALQAISKEQADQAETEWNTSLAAVDAAQAQLDGERTHLVEVLEVPIGESGIPEDVDTVPVRAPASGVVIERKATVGSVATAGDPLVAITDPSLLWVIANVDEADLSSLRPGQSVNVQVRAYPGRNFHGRIEKLGEQLDPVTRTLEVRVAVPNEQGLLKPEMFATVDILRQAIPQAIAIPRGAIQDIEGKPTVFLETAAFHYRPQPVVTGQSVGERVQVVSGLKPGDRVVVEGSFGLKSEALSNLKGGE
jgi:cobalt-zinc-cadmium efflux system membrane fusion protein